MTDSTEIPWTEVRENEHYNILGLSFDVNEAKRILVESSHPVLNVPRAKLNNWFSEPEGAKPNTINMLSGFRDEERVEPADLSIPLIFVSTPGFGSFLIDGHHRLEKGRRMNVKTFKVVVISDLPEVKQVISEQSLPGQRTNALKPREDD